MFEESAENEETSWKDARRETIHRRWIVWISLDNLRQLQLFGYISPNLALSGDISARRFSQ